MAQKKSKELSSKILVQKGTNLTRNKRPRNHFRHLHLPNLFLHQDEEKREVRRKAERSEGGDHLFRLGLQLLLIPRALRVRNQEVPHCIERRSF